MRAIDIDILRLSRRLATMDRESITGSRPGIELIELDDSYVRVRTAGAGPRTIVVACDPPNVVENYDAFIAALEADFRVVIFEQPGFGFSYPRAGFDFTRRGYARIVAQLLDRLGHGPYVLAFPCIANFHGLQIAFDRPELVEKLVLMQATSWPTQRKWVTQVVGAFTTLLSGITEFGDMGEKMTAVPFLGQGIWAVAEPSFARQTHKYAVYRSAERPELFNSLAGPLEDAFERGACNCMASSYQNYFLDDEPEIPVVAQDTLVLWANRDRMHRDSDPRGLLRYAPQARWEEIPYTGHHLELENPEAVTAAIRRFLAV